MAEASFRDPLADLDLDALLQAVANGEALPDADLRGAASALIVRRRAQRLARQRYAEALWSFSSLEGFSPGDFAGSVKLLTALAARTIEVERTSVWLFGEGQAELRCLDLYERSAERHSTVPTLRRERYPTYFEACASSRVISAPDAETDPLTSEFAADYLRPQAIRSMLDTPIHYQGQIAGVLCIESVSERRDWSWDEQVFVASLGDLMSLLLEASKRFETELRLVEQRLELSTTQELSRQKSEFVQVVAHELRTPLTAVQGYLELLEEEPHEGQDAPAYVEGALGGVSSLKHLLEDLSDLAALETGQFKLLKTALDLGGTLADCVATLAPQAAAKRVTIWLDASQDLEVEADAQRVRQITLNLLTNALKFTPEGGEVRVRLSSSEGGATVEVSDKGPGIAPEDLERLFKRFSQLEAGRAKGGLGLGLSIAKALVTAHGGQMGVRTVPGEGSTFWYSLPLAGAGVPSAG